MDSPLRWFGGKYRILGDLLPLFPPHSVWIDVFGGGGSVTIAKVPCGLEVFNDLDEEVFNFYRVIQDRAKGKRLYELAALTPYSRQWFESIRDGEEDWSEPPADDVERAYRFLVVNRMAYGGNSSFKNRPSWSFSVSLERQSAAASVAVWLKGVEGLLEVSDRLRRVQVEHLDFRDLMHRYREAPADETLWYFDPPYVPETRVAGGYRHEMTMDDHAELVSRLLDLKGMAVLSGYAHPLYEPLEAAGWERREFETRVFCSGKNATKSRRVECVWRNPAALRSGQLSLLEGAA